MKKTLILAALLAASTLTFSCKSGNTSSETQTAGQIESSSAKTDTVAAPGSIVYFNLDVVLDRYDYARDLSAAVQAKVDGMSQEVNRRQNKLENDIKAFQDKINKGVLTSSVAQKQNEDLQRAQLEFQNYAGKKQQDAAEEQQVMMNKIADAINTYVVKFNAEKGYALILSTQGQNLTLPVVTGDPKFDITDEIIAGLNEDYAKNPKEK